MTKPRKLVAGPKAEAPCLRRRSIQRRRSGAACFVTGNTRPHVPIKISMPSPSAHARRSVSEKSASNWRHRSGGIAITRRKIFDRLGVSQVESAASRDEKLPTGRRTCGRPASSSIPPPKSLQPRASPPGRRPPPPHLPFRSPYCCYRLDIGPLRQARDSDPICPYVTKRKFPIRRPNMSGIHSRRK